MSSVMLLAALLPLALIACGAPLSMRVRPVSTAGPVALLALPAPRYRIMERKDVAYGPLASEKLDLCYPTALKNPRPGVLIIHGGGWTAGDKGGLGTYCTLLAQQGFVVANINYRLAQPGRVATQWPAQLVDVQLAVRWLRTYARQLNLDSRRLCAWGTSAGGHLAVFLGALKKIHPGDEAALLSNQSPAVSCVVDYFGPVDLTQKFPLLTTQLAALLGGATPQSNPPLYHDASPIFSIAADMAPTAIVQGSLDTTVPPAQSQELLHALQHEKVPTQYISYNGGHSFYGLTPRQRMSLDATLFKYLVQQEHP